MYTLFIGNKNYSSWSLRPWLLMRMLDIPFREKLVCFVPGGSRDTFRPFSRSGLVPCLRDGVVSVWDSLAITEYLAERHEGVWPGDTAVRAWARCVTAEMHSGFSALRGQCPMNCGVRVKPGAVDGSLGDDIDRIDEIWCEGLDRHGGPFLAGSRFTAADAFFAPVAFRIQTFGLPLSDMAQAYATRILALEPMVEWYQAALEEPWRERQHEDEIAETGTVLQDFRRA